MANSIPGEAGDRVHRAFRDLNATFGVNLSDAFYRMSRNLAEALRTIEPKDERERQQRDAFIAECERHAESSLTGERRGDGNG
jgi:hypothetical protein